MDERVLRLLDMMPPVPNSLLRDEVRRQYACDVANYGTGWVVPAEITKEDALAIQRAVANKETIVGYSYPYYITDCADAAVRTASDKDCQCQ